MKTHIPHSKPTLGDEEIEAVAQVIAAGHIACGNQVELFEQEVARYIGVGGAVAESSGSAALHLALLSLKIKPGDQVIIPDYTCTAVLNAVKYIGAHPVLADIEPHNYNLDPQKAKSALTKKTKAIIVPHMLGQAADIEGLSSLGVPVIEDCAQSLGGVYQNRRLGAFGTLSVCSFYATKVISTGEGGMVVSDREDLLTRIRDLNRYDNQKRYKIRYNYKMTDIAAAIGRVQLGRLPKMLARRRQIARIYLDGLSGCGFGFPEANRDHIFYRFVILVSDGVEKKIKQLRKLGIECARPVYQPLHHYLKQEGFPVAQSVWEQALSLPIYPSLGNEHVQFIIRSIKGL